MSKMTRLEMRKLGQLNALRDVGILAHEEYMQEVELLRSFPGWMANVDYPTPEEEVIIARYGRYLAKVLARAQYE